MASSVKKDLAACSKCLLLKSQPSRHPATDCPLVRADVPLLCYTEVPGLRGCDTLFAAWLQMSSLFPFPSQLLLPLSLLAKANSVSMPSLFLASSLLLCLLHPTCVSAADGWGTAEYWCPDPSPAWSRCPLMELMCGCWAAFRRHHSVTVSSSFPFVAVVCFLLGSQLSQIVEVTRNLASAYILFSICFGGASQIQINHSNTQWDTHIKW